MSRLKVKKKEIEIVISKVKRIDEEEKPNKYFLTLASRNYINKQILKTC